MPGNDPHFMGGLTRLLEDTGTNPPTRDGQGASRLPRVRLRGGHGGSWTGAREPGTYSVNREAVRRDQQGVPTLPFRYGRSLGGRTRRALVVATCRLPLELNPSSSTVKAFQPTMR